MATEKLEYLSQPPPPPARRFVVVAKELAVAPHVVAGVKHLRRWDDESLVTASDVSAAVSEVLSITLG
jgi:hypothetical protein